MRRSLRKIHAGAVRVSAVSGAMHILMLEPAQAASDGAQGAGGHCHAHTVADCCLSVCLSECLSVCLSV